MSEDKEIVHAMVLPFPVDNLSTWCGRRLGEDRVKGDLVAYAPESVTCIYCIQSMKDALGMLKEWVPRLSVK